jgi:hypothetical protein
MSLQKINKKPFKSPFNNPPKNSATHPQRQIPFCKHEDTTQDQVMVRFLFLIIIIPTRLRST